MVLAMEVVSDRREDGPVKRPHVKPWAIEAFLPSNHEPMTNHGGI